MFKCKVCEKTFDHPKIRYISHGMDTPPFEMVSECPLCGRSEIEVKAQNFCFFCGLEIPEGQRYCNKSCERLGEPYRIRAEKRRAEIKGFEISKAVAEVTAYNKAHGTNYSYGKYFALKGLGKIHEN